MYLVDQLHTVIKGCQEKKPEAQRALYDMFKTKMFGICLRYAGNYDDAQDILQDGFIKVFDKIHQFRFSGAFEGWIRRIMVNTALEKYRLHYSHIPADENLLNLEKEETSEIGSDIDADTLVRVVQELTPKYRVVFNLYAIEGMSHKEISKMLKISEGTSKSNLSRARAILQEKVSKLYIKSVQTF